MVSYERPSWRPKSSATRLVVQRPAGRRKYETPKLHITGLLWENLTVSGEFPHNGPVIRKTFHVMKSTSQCLRFTQVKWHHWQIDGLVQERRNSSALTMGWNVSRTNHRDSMITTSWYQKYFIASKMKNIKLQQKPLHYIQTLLLSMPEDHFESR